MKTVITFLVLLVLCNCKIYSQDPTYAGIPDANRVLVVYNSNSDTSFMVANYYKNVRNIPTSNIVPLFLPDSVPVTYQGSTHYVGIRQETDIILDLYNNSIGTWTPTFHAWKYYLVILPLKSTY